VIINSQRVEDLIPAFWSLLIFKAWMCVWSIKNFIKLKTGKSVFWRKTLQVTFKFLPYLFKKENSIELLYLILNFPSISKWKLCPNEHNLVTSFPWVRHIFTHTYSNFKKSAIVILSICSISSMMGQPSFLL
jgi:hypothetical protein